MIMALNNLELEDIEKEITVEKGFTLFIPLDIIPYQPNFKWFLTNEEELNNANINPIGLTHSTVELLDNKFTFTFNILEGAIDSEAKFSYKENHDSPDENAPKKKIKIKILENKIHDIDVFFSKYEDEFLNVKEISDIDSDEIILEKKKSKKIIIKGKKKKNYSWFIFNYAELKNKFFIGDLADPVKGELTFKPDYPKVKEGEDEDVDEEEDEVKEGHFEFLLKVKELKKIDLFLLPKIRLIYKKTENDNLFIIDKNVMKKDIVIKIFNKNKNERKFKNCVNFCNKWYIPLYLMHLVIILGSVYILGHSRSIHDDATIIDIISQDLLKDLNFGYITEITRLSKEEENEDVFIFDKWQGTVDGCGNKKTMIPNVTVLPEKGCPDGFEFLEKIPPIEIVNYKGFVLEMEAPIYISYKKLLYDGSIIKNNETCPKGKKSCGYIDTKDNLLCLDKNLSCPINYIKFAKNPPPGITNLKTIEGEELNIYYSNDPYENKAGIPYVQTIFRIGEDQLCTIPSLYYTNLKLFELDAFKKSYANQCVLNGYNQQTTKLLEYYYSLDSINNYRLYYDNNIIQKINASGLIEYGFNINKYKDIKLHLYVRRHYGYDKKCLENREKKYDIETQLRLMNGIGDQMRSWSEEMLWNIPTPFISLSDFFSITNYFNRPDWRTAESLMKLSTVLSFNVYFSIKSFLANNFNDPIEDEMTCSDVYVNDNYNLMTKKMRESGQRILECMVANIIIAVLNLLGLIYKIIVDFCLIKKDSIVINRYKYKIKQLNEHLLKVQDELNKKKDEEQ